MELSLSRRERDIISCVQLAADRPLSEVAKETNLKLHTVRYVSHVKILPIACEHMASSIPNIELVMG